MSNTAQQFAATIFAFGSSNNMPMSNPLEIDAVVKAWNKSNSDFNKIMSEHRPENTAMLKSACGL